MAWGGGPTVVSFHQKSEEIPIETKKICCANIHQSIFIGLALKFGSLKTQVYNFLSLFD